MKDSDNRYGRFSDERREDESSRDGRNYNDERGSESREGETFMETVTREYIRPLSIAAGILVLTVILFGGASAHIKALIFNIFSS